MDDRRLLDTEFFLNRRGGIDCISADVNHSRRVEDISVTFAVTDSNGDPVPLTLVSTGAVDDTDPKHPVYSPTVYKYVSDVTLPANGYSNIIVTPDSGSIVLIGFEDGTELTLTETAAPTGYNLLDRTITLTVHAVTGGRLNPNPAITADVPFETSASTQQTPVNATFIHGNDDTYTDNQTSVTVPLTSNSIIGVENNTGSELPSTGGIGTKIFMIGGSILVLAAGVFLVAMSVSKRRSEEN